MIGVITLLAIVGGYLVGCWLIGWLYNTDLMSFRIEMCILLLGGGMLSFVNFFAVIITVIRCQRYLTWGYVFVAVIAKLFSGYFVETNGITGASVLYTGLMTLLSMVFAAELIICVKKRMK